MRPAKSRASAAAACMATVRSKARSWVAVFSRAALRDERPRRRSRRISSLVREAGRGSMRQRLLDLGFQYEFEIGFADRTDQLIGDLAVAADEEGFRDAVDAP